jgi:hypothetical protein
LLVCKSHQLQETDAVEQFIRKHSSQVVGVISGWDRIRFRGTLRVLAAVPGLFTWLREQRVLLKEFDRFALRQTAWLKASVEQVAASAKRTIEYVASSALSKEALVQELLRREGCHDGMTTFGSRDVMRFLGRTRLPQGAGVDSRFQGEVVSDLRQRPEGVRIKHRLNANSIKMYDKQGSVLRIETTITDARDLRVHRASETAPNGPKRLRRLRKGVVDLPRRAQISQAANERYLSALATVEAESPLSQVLDRLSQPRLRHGHRSRGLHPLEGIDARVAEHLLRGEFTLNGFRNRDLRRLLFPPTDDPLAIRRQSAQVSRLLRLFRDHRLIYRVKGTHRYQLSTAGRRTLPLFPAARNANAQKLFQLAN